VLLLLVAGFAGVAVPLASGALPVVPFGTAVFLAGTVAGVAAEFLVLTSLAESLFPSGI
jgi:hypothetical protein